MATNRNKSEKPKIRLSSFQEAADMELEYALTLSYEERLNLLEKLRRMSFGEAYTNYKEPKIKIVKIVRGNK